MPAYVNPNECNSCQGRFEPECQRICPADIVHFDAATDKPLIIEPESCWECFACVKACPESAMGVRGAADVMPIGASAVPRRGLSSISWTVTFRNGDSRAFEFPIRTTPWGSIEPYAGLAPANLAGLKSETLCDGQEKLAATRAQDAAGL